ncbi:MAG: hypothetical protein ACXW16_06655, partial [Burkholderiaceae bacterium]
MHLKTFVAAFFLALLTACATNNPQQAASSATLDRNAGQWRTWVLASGQELRLQPPPDAAATAAELQQLRTFTSQRDAQMQQRIRYWDFWSPSHRWNDMLIDISSANPIPGGGAMRTFA